MSYGYQGMGQYNQPQYQGMPNNVMQADLTRLQNLQMAQNPQQFQQQQQQQQMFQQQTPKLQLPQQPQYNLSRGEFVQVKDVDQAREYILQNNEILWMRDSSKPYLYVKAVNPIGAPSFTILKIEEVDEVTMKQDENNEQGNGIKFVVEETFDALSEKVLGLEDKLKQYEQFINNLLQQQVQAPVTQQEPQPIKSGRAKKVGDVSE